MFKPVDAKKTLSQVENDLIKYWNENKIFERSVNQREENEKFVFFDGPPFANGLPHYGHVLATSLKDAVTRYWSMKGYYTPRTNGWDCHGLPVEYEIEKNLKISGHKEISAFGIDKFNDTCRASVFTYTTQWEELLERLGRWLDTENGYATLENTYMESIWWVFNSIWEKNLVYKGLRPMHICPRCETPLSNFEVTQGYKDITDLSATVKFKLEDEPNTYILAWTTTPWTLPANQGLALNPEIEYIKVKYKNSFYVLAKERLEYVFKDKLEDIESTENFNPKEWEGKKYKALFNYYEGLHSDNYQILLADFVSTESGTGIVHIAGGFGEDDYKLVKSKKMKPLLNIGMDGIYFDEVKDFAGKFVKGQDQNINKFLDEKGLLFKQENYRHSYPHCWRCDTPLLNYSLAAWFIGVTEIQDKLIKNNKLINWQPSHIKEGRFGKWLENVRDWNVSRNRFWGCPMPIWESESDKQVCIESLDKLRKNSTKGNNLFISRHGEADHNLLHICSSDINDKRELSELGITQVKKQASKLKDAKIDIIYHSPFHRTTQTAKIIAKEIGVTNLETDKRLVEINVGEFNNKNLKLYIEARAEAKSFYHYKAGNTGESLKDVDKRIMDFINSLSSKHEGKNILIVTHGGVIRTLLKHYQPNQSHFKQKIEHDNVYNFYSGKVPTNSKGELDMHKPYIDDIELEINGENYKRVSEVFDCWFESGSMPYAQLHYPFENKEEFEKNFPANFIAEGLDQTRGWFYTLHVISTILFDKPAFKNIIVNGTLLSQAGEKLSKSKKNYPDPSKLFESKGVDALRLFLYQSTAALGEDIRFYEDAVDEIMKKFSLTLWNTYSFFVTYANIDEFEASEHELDLNKMHELDRWLLSELNELIDEVTTHMDNYNLSKATRPLIKFVDNLSNWYIRRSRRRFWKSENDEQKYLAYKTLHTVLSELCKLIAPFTPFIADEIFINLSGKDSVHLEDWPTSRPEFINKELNYKMQLARTIVSMGHSLRAKENLKVRQPLNMIQIAVPKATDSQYINELKEVICEELNIKKIDQIDNPEELTNQILKPKSKVLGAKLGSKMKDVIIAAKKGDYTLESNTVQIADESLSLEDFDIQFTAKEGFSAEAQDGIVVILDTTITQELKNEGYVREIVRQIQEFRKELDLKVDDKIYLYLKTDSKTLENAITEHANYLRTETLALELQQSGNFEWDSEKYIKINEEEITLALKKANA